MARDRPVQDLRQAHRDHLTDQECPIIDALRDDHQVTLPKKLLRLWTQLHAHGVLSSLSVALIPEDNNLTQGCRALPLWTAENPVQIQRWDFFYSEWGVLSFFFGTFFFGSCEYGRLRRNPAQAALLLLTQ